MKSDMKNGQKISLVWLTAILLLLGIVWLAYYTKFFKSSSAVRVVSNLSYCKSDNPGQTLDLYKPRRKFSKPLPVVVYVHGGGWRSGSKRNPLISKTYADFFASEGLATISVGYRLDPARPYPDQNYDVACALSYIENHSSELGVDTDRMLFFGESAGAELASFASLNIPFMGHDYDAPVGVISFYGVFDFSKIITGQKPDFNARRYLGSKYNQKASPASPTSHVTKKAPRFLLVHGSGDTVVPFSQSELFYKKLTDAGVDAELVAIPRANHGFSGPELSPYGFDRLKESLRLFIAETIYPEHQQSQ